MLHLSLKTILARRTDLRICPDCESTFWTNPFHPKTFNETRHNDNSQKKNDKKGDFPKTDRHFLRSGVLHTQSDKSADSRYALKPRKVTRFVSCIVSICGVSMMSGISANRESLRIYANAVAPILPSPMCSCRSTRL